MKTSLKEKVQIYENLLHLLHTHYAITLNSEKVKEILNKISNWSYARRSGNGELSDKQQTKLISKYLEEFKKL